jgi:hypothetical protein
MTRCCLQTFKPTHKEKQGLTKPVSPELLTKRRAVMVRACSWLSYTYLELTHCFRTSAQRLALAANQGGRLILTCCCYCYAGRRVY